MNDYINPNQCPECGSDLRIIPAGVSKKTNKPYNSFTACSNRECSYKPPRNAPDAPISRASVKDDVSASHQISDAMSRKEAGIKKFTDKKEQGMIYFSALRSAGEFMTVMYHVDGVNPISEEEYHKRFWEQQRKFYKEIMEDPTR